ncbi:MAG TPA: anthranilate synthase component I family protein [Parafilimonas sp.]|nr:anthranilate synthase component I family protein [Parafilimonas sp.]
MQRQQATYHVENTEIFKMQMLNWASQFSICCFMDSHFYEDKYHSFDCLLAVNAVQVFSPSKNILTQLDEFYNNANDWIFGHLNYDLKNEIENLQSKKTNQINFPDIFLFRPQIVIALNKNIVEISFLDINSNDIFEAITKTEIENKVPLKSTNKINAATSEPEYLATIENLKKHILRGDCYEINFCQEFFIESADINPLETYIHLLKISPSPFSCFYKLHDKYLLCASPERFLSKYDQTIFSQPIKGTAARNKDDSLDMMQKQNLYNSPKEKSENVMVVDLVRNDLSKICKEGSVITNELFGIYSFPQVHQMISTISGTLRDEILFSEIIKAVFPMGSMTGAPKHRVMQLIEQYETTKRGLFSGSVGYITPQKNFDFNVVIRSIFYNEDNKYLNYFVGSGITIYADAESEYKECRLKASAIEKVLS